MLTPKLWRTPKHPRCFASLRRKRSALWADLLRIHWRALRPSKPPSNKKERLYEAVSEPSLAFSGRALAPLPHPPRASTKTKTWLWMVGLVQPLCLSVEPCEIEQKGPGRTRSNAACPRLSKMRLRSFCHRPTVYESGVPSGRNCARCGGGIRYKRVSFPVDNQV